MAMTTYVGHGDVRGWGGETTSLGDRIHETAAVPLLGNGDRLTFLAALDCLNGFFSRPFDYSLGELLVNTPGKGAVASLAPSGLGFTWEHGLLGEELFDLAFAAPTPPLGRLATRAKLRAHARGATIDLVKTFTLLGDPATRLALPTP